MLNPYASPTVREMHPAPGPITDAQVEQLIAGVDVETITIGEVSDIHFYGGKFSRVLNGDLAERAKRAGLEPVVF